MDVIKRLNECGNEFVAGGGFIDNAIAFEIAESLLEDPEVLQAAMRLWPNKSKDMLAKIMADYV